MKNQLMADVPIGTSRSQAVRWHLSLLLSHHGSAHYPLADCGHTTDNQLPHASIVRDVGFLE